MVLQVMVLSGKAQDFTARMTKEQVLDVINNGSNQLGYAMGMMPPGMAQVSRLKRSLLMWLVV